MTEQSLMDIAVGAISPSPFQHRRVFDDAGLRELAKSIEQDGLIQPITVRPYKAGYELIAGERRWRAVRQFTALKTIQARVLHVNDLQARRLCATENLQRADLTSLEEVLAMAELVDASMMEFSPEYAPLSPVQEPKWRVKTLLMKLESDRRNKTDYVTGKFSGKTEAIFSGLPKPKLFASFLDKELPLLFTPDEVQQFALEHKLNKSQTNAFNQLQKAAPKVFMELSKNTPEEAAKKVARLADPFSSITNTIEFESIGDLSAQTISKAARSLASEQNPVIQNHRAQGTGENEWYTPSEYLDAVRAVLGGIDLDPASSYLANKTVRAVRYFTQRENGLEKVWAGRVFMNPPYSQPEIARFAEKLAAEWESGNIDAAIALTHNYTDTAWFHRLASTCTAICFTRGRIGFISPEGKKASPTQGQAFFYFGANAAEFINNFSEIGIVMVPNELR